MICVLTPKTRKDSRKWNLLRAKWCLVHVWASGHRGDRGSSVKTTAHLSLRQMTEIGFVMLSAVRSNSPCRCGTKQWQLLSVWSKTGNLFGWEIFFALEQVWRRRWDDETWSCSLRSCGFIYSSSAAGTQPWPCRCSITPDTAPGGGWRWWSLLCGFFPSPSPALYCLDSTTLVMATFDLSSQVAPSLLVYSRWRFP